MASLVETHLIVVFALEVARDGYDMVCCACSAFCSVGADAASKASGDDAFRAGDFALAVERFSRVIATEPRFVAALSNRAAAYLAAEDVPNCIADCGAALALLGVGSDSGGSAADGAAPSLSAHTQSQAAIDVVPPAGSARHKSFVVTLLVRRGTAQAKVGNLVDALSDYSAAAKLDPTNSSVALEVKRLKARVGAE